MRGGVPEDGRLIKWVSGLTSLVPDNFLHFSKRRETRGVDAAWCGHGRENIVSSFTFSRVGSVETVADYLADALCGY